MMIKNRLLLTIVFITMFTSFKPVNVVLAEEVVYPVFVQTEQDLFNVETPSEEFPSSASYCMGCITYFFDYNDTQWFGAHSHLPVGQSFIYIKPFQTINVYYSNEEMITYKVISVETYRAEEFSNPYSDYYDDEGNKYTSTELVKFISSRSDIVLQTCTGNGRKFILATKY